MTKMGSPCGCRYDFCTCCALIMVSFSVMKKDSVLNDLCFELQVRLLTLRKYRIQQLVIPVSKIHYQLHLPGQWQHQSTKQFPSASRLLATAIRGEPDSH